MIGLWPALIEVNPPESIAAYCAAKHAVVGLTRAAALAYASAGLRVNAACPGYARTPMIDRVVDRDPEAEGRMVIAEPKGRRGAAR